MTLQEKKEFEEINKLFDNIIEKEKDKPIRDPEMCHKFYFTCLNHFKRL